MAVRIGINPNTWTLDDVPALKHFTPLEQCLAEARAAGYAGIEMGGIFPRTGAELKPLMARHGLALISGWYDGRIRDRSPAAELEAARPHLELLKEMGCRGVVYADVSGGNFGDPASPLSARPRLAADEWPAYGAKVTALAEAMADFGVPMGFHHHIGTVVESDAEVDLLMAHTGAAVGLLLDTGHSLLAGGDPLALARRHAPRVVHFHGKDVRRPVLDAVLREDRSFIRAVLDGVFTVPGDGCIDYVAILGLLREAGYRGWLVVEAEQDLKLAHPMTYARLGFDHLTRLATAAGFAIAG
jgi:inosose dehydratase